MAGLESLTAAPRGRAQREPVRFTSPRGSGSVGEQEAKEQEAG